MDNNLIFEEGDVQLFCMGGLDYEKIINWTTAEYSDIGTIYHNSILTLNGKIQVHKGNIEHRGEGRKLITFIDTPLDYCSNFLFTKNVILVLRDCYNTFAARYHRIKGGDNTYGINDYAVNLWKQYAKEFKERSRLKNCFYVNANTAMPDEDGWKLYQDDKDYLAVFDDELVELSDVIFNFDAKLSYQGVLSEKRLIEQSLAGANLLLSRGEKEKAKAILQQALVVQPNNTNLKQQLAITIAEDDLNSALDILLTEAPSAQLHNNIAMVYANTNQYEKAIAHGKKALEFADTPELQNALGHYYLNNYQFEESLEAFEKASVDKRFYVQTNIGNVHACMRNFDKAFEAYNEVLKYNPDAHGVKVNLGFLNYIVGNKKLAWELCESRLHTELSDYLKQFGEDKLWRGQKIEGKKLLIFGEQGLGDNINFVRYISPLKRMFKCQTVLICSEQLHDLFKYCGGIDEFARKEDNKYDDFYDYHIPLMSLPLYVQGIPPRPYINYKENIEMPRDSLNVGICWKGNPKYPNDHYRSCPIEYFKELIHPKVKIYNLQHGEKLDWAENPELNNFTTTAKIINSLDLIITVDTSILHLAGALEKRTFGLLAYVFDWRWQLGDKTSWYNNVRLFRQATRGDWQGVMANVKKEVLRTLNYRYNCRS